MLSNNVTSIGDLRICYIESYALVQIQMNQAISKHMKARY